MAGCFNSGINTVVLTMTILYIAEIPMIDFICIIQHKYIYAVKNVVEKQIIVVIYVAVN